MIDDYGRVILSPDEIFEAMYLGHDLTTLLATDSPEIAAYNDRVRQYDRGEFVVPVAQPLDHSPEEEHSRRQTKWFVPDRYLEMDIWAVLIGRCGSEAEKLRMAIEQREYEKRGLNPLLSLMFYLVDDFRERKIVWGVGRGSSVASFALYKIGITKINPMLYGLEISEFLRD